MSLLKKKESKQAEAPVSAEPAKYRIVNLVEAIQSVAYYNDEGKVSYLNLRIQGRGGQTPPVLSQSAITAQMLDLQKRKLIRLEKI